MNEKMQVKFYGVEVEVECWESTEHDGVGEYPIYYCRITSKEYPPILAHSLFDSSRAVGNAFKRLYESLTK